jgi:hypothetical protein
MASYTVVSVAVSVYTSTNHAQTDKPFVLVDKYLARMVSLYRYANPTQTHIYNTLYSY